jgi:GWxTD domain-containing protein
MFALAISAALLAGGLRDVRLLVLPEEDALYAQLKDPADRAEFERIFWARRDLDPTTPANELQSAVARARTNADALFTRPGLKGADTDCGQLFVLLGEPPEVVGREATVHFDAAQALRGARRPEIWIYRSRPGDAVTFTGGELRVSLDEECRFAEGARVREDLLRVARSRVVIPGPPTRRRRTDISRVWRTRARPSPPLPRPRGRSRPAPTSRSRSSRSCCCAPRAAKPTRPVSSAPSWAWARATAPRRRPWRPP